MTTRLYVTLACIGAIGCATVSRSRAEGIIVNGGGSILVTKTSIKVECGDVTIRPGGSLTLDHGFIEGCRHFTIACGGQLSGTGWLGLSGTWRNNSAFARGPGCTIRFTSSCGTPFSADGTGDTDADGVSDRGEGFRDTNADGIPDFLDPAVAEVINQIPVDWLSHYNLPTDHTADHADSDGDGMSNWAEYFALTDPTDPASVLLLHINAAPGDPGRMLLRWATACGKRYDLQCTTNMTGPPEYQTRCTNVLGHLGSTTITDAVANSSAPLCYRLHVRP